MWAPTRRSHRAHEDGDNLRLDAAVIDGVTRRREQRRVMEMALLHDGEEGKDFFASSMSCTRG
jgi:hypothetical protein